MTELVLMEKKDTTVVLTLNSPKTRNALSRELSLELHRLLKEAMEDKGCRAIVLTGAEGHFCSGGDLNNMKAERTLAIGRERMALGGDNTRLIAAGPKPVITAVEGYAAGAGFSLATASDYVVASKASAFVSAFCKVGLIPDMGMLWSLAQRVSLGQAKRIIASARKVAAEEAYELGIADQLAEPGTSLEVALEVAKEFSVGAPIPYAMVKAAYARGVTSLEEALRCEMELQSSLYLTKDHREAVAAFLEKRAPQFKGE